MKGTFSSINLSEVSQFKKKWKDVNSGEVDEWMTNQNALLLKLIQPYDEPKESTFVTKSIAKIPDVRLKKNLRLKCSKVFSMQKGVPLNHKTAKY